MKKIKIEEEEDNGGEEKKNDINADADANDRYPEQVLRPASPYDEDVDERSKDFAVDGEAGSDEETGSDEDFGRDEDSDSERDDAGDARFYGRP